MKANELRIGNFVQGDPISIPRLGIRGDGITSVTAYGISLINDGVLKVNPIPLTEEWLLKFGFAEDKHGDYEIRIKYHIVSVDVRCTSVMGLVHMTTITDEGIGNPDMWQELTVCKYIHQLQNLYFALTGEELELNKF